jgi:hypothetical protein
MKQFNKVITVEVSVDTIANQLLDSMSMDFKHRELVAESIIGRMLNDNSLTFLYNSLNGYACDINFEKGDDLCANDGGFSEYGYWTPESIEQNNSVMQYIKSVQVVEVDVYRDNKLLVEYYVPNKEGINVRNTKWVNHTRWSKI